jgi:poly(A) polymerase Pap1
VVELAVSSTRYGVTPDAGLDLVPQTSFRATCRAASFLAQRRALTVTAMTPSVQTRHERSRV